MTTLLLSDLDARRTFDAFNVLRRVAQDVGARVVCAEERARRSSPYGATRTLRLATQTMFDDDLRALAAEADGSLVVIPCSEELLERMLDAQGRAALPANVRALLPSGASFARAIDKGALPAVARDAGVHAPALVPPPWTRAALVPRLPLVAKPRTGRGGVGVRHLLSAGDVGKALDALDPTHDLVMARLAGGTVFGAFFLYEAGRCVAQYGHQRVRTFPASGGVSTCAVRCDDDDALAVGRAVLDVLAWNGLAMVEVMHDTRRARPSLIEINPRLWGSLLLDEFSGAFLLRNYVRRCLDLQLAEAKPRTATFRWSAGEALHAAQARDPRALVVNPLDVVTCWSGVTYARRRDAARFLARNALAPGSIGKLKRKWTTR